MASTYSSDLKIELITTGEESGDWGAITNENFANVFEQAIVGRGNPVFAADANLTLTYTNSVASQTARNLFLDVTSSLSLTATRSLIVPTIYKNYVVANNTTGGQSITVKTTAGTGITIPNGRKAALYVDNTNVVVAWDWVDINGGSIDGTPIGANTASTGAFTSATVNGVTVVTTTATQTITNKTLTSPVITTPTISSIINGGTLTLPTSTDTLVGRATTDTLTNKTISGASNTLANIANASLTNSSVTINSTSVSLGGSITVTAVNPNALTIGTGLSGTSYNGSSAVTVAIDSTVATLTGVQTLTNKTLTSPTINSAALSGTLSGSPNFSGAPTIGSVAIVTTTGTQTLTNKTLTTPTVNGAAFSGTFSGTPTFSGNITFSSTGAITVPTGTTGQRPSAVAGMIRFNSSGTAFEGYNGSGWASIGGASGGTGNPFVYENDITVTTDYTLTTGKNGMSAGPITINTGVTVTVPDDSSWVIV